MQHQAFHEAVQGVAGNAALLERAGRRCETAQGRTEVEGTTAFIFVAANVWIGVCVAQEGFDDLRIGTASCGGHQEAFGPRGKHSAGVLDLKPSNGGNVALEHS
mmetsp:Transcript_21872/g.62488  ORF Transcript_21872/g.62488 Transcript_21872/m.62488 type:complete len:104 (-) Transcript_21872:954-1265(-)